MTALTIDARAKDGVLLDPEYYGRFGYPHEEWSRLRRESPVSLVEPEQGIGLREDRFGQQIDGPRMVHGREDHHGLLSCRRVL